MAFRVEYMSQYQKDLYKERQTNDNPSRTYRSDIFQTFDQLQNKPAAFLNYSAAEGDSSEANVKVPWGRSRSYAGDGPICLPTEHRPKCEPPPVLQKTHHHFGSGLFAYPRGYPFSQDYDLTLLKKSNLRWNDELIPRPSTSQLHDKQIKVTFPQEHPLSSHMSRHALFPKFDNPTIDPLENIEEDPCLPKLVPVQSPPTIVVHKAMGNFARREICTPQTNSTRQPLTWPSRNKQRLPGISTIDNEGELDRKLTKPETMFAQLAMTRNTWFSRHDVISEFNKQYPSVIPRIALNIQKKKPADWLISNPSLNITETNVLELE